MKYSLALRKLPIPKGGQRELYYATPVSQQTVSMRSLCELMAKHTTVSRADIFAVLEQLSDSIQYLTSMGMTVEVGELGYFRPTFKSQGVSDPKLFNPMKHISDPQIVFLMKRNFKKLHDVSYERTAPARKSRAKRAGKDDK